MRHAIKVTTGREGKHAKGMGLVGNPEQKLF